MESLKQEIMSVAKSTKLGIDTSKLQFDLALSTQGVDSIGMFSLVLALQEKFQIEIPDEDFEKFDSLMTITDYVDRRLRAK